MSDNRTAEIGSEAAEEDLRHLPSVDHVFRNALDAGAEPESLVAPWVQFGIECGSLANARAALEACFRTSRPVELEPDWTWSAALRSLPALRGQLHITHYYQLDDLHLAGRDRRGADDVMREAIAAFPSYSGPVLRLADRLCTDGHSLNALALLEDFLGHEPADTSAIIAYLKTAAAHRPLPVIHGVLETALSVGAPVAAVFPAWLNLCFESKDVAAARSAVESCADKLGMALTGRWSWSRALKASPALRAAMHLTHYYALDDEMVRTGKRKEADAILRIAGAANPEWTGPALRLADRCGQDGDEAAAAKLLAGALRKAPGDLHAAVRYACMRLPHGEEPRRASILRKAIAHGVPLASLLCHWLESCFAAGNVEAAKRAIEEHAEALGLAPLPASWDWTYALEKSSLLRASLHITHYYFLDSYLASRGEAARSERVLLICIAQHPKLSGPVLRLAERYLEQGSQDTARSLADSFDRRVPGDLYIQSFLRRLDDRSSSRKAAFRCLMTPAVRIDVERRLELCRRLSKRSLTKTRSLNLMIDLFTRFDLDLNLNALPILPTLFEIHAFDPQALQHLAGRIDVADEELRRHLRPRRFGFVRGVLAYYHQQFSDAQRELENWVQSKPQTNAAAAARDVVNFLRSTALRDEDYCRRIRSHQPDFKRYAGRRLAVLTEGQPADVEEILLKLPEDCRVSVCFGQLTNDHREPPRTNISYITPDPLIWYTEHGKSLHRRLETVTTATMSKVRDTSTRFDTVPWALTTFMVDEGIYSFAALQRLDTELDTGSYDELLVITRRHAIFSAARSIAEGRLEDSQIEAVWITVPALPPNPGFVYWQSKRPCPISNARPALLDPMIVPRLPGATPRTREMAAPALLVWSIGEANYDLALRRVISEILDRRPLILLAFGDTDERIDQLCTDLAPLAKACGHPLQVLRYADFLDLSRSSRPETAPAVMQAAQAAADALTDEHDKPAAAFARHELANTIANSVHLNALAVVLDWLDVAIQTLKPAYVMTAPGRSPLPAAISEHCQSHGIPAIDVQLYFLADSARQIKTPHRYHATIDTVTETFLTDRWKLDPSQLVKVGYLWQRPHGSDRRGIGTQHSLPPSANRAKTILVATQPGPPHLSESFLAAVLQSVQSLANCRVVIKPHPKEPDGIIGQYARLIDIHRLADRTQLADRKQNIDDLMREADIVVTRYSNVALQAAQMLKPVIRCVFLDKQYSGSFVDRPYAINTERIEDLAEHISALTKGEDACRVLCKRQAEYLAANPSLIDGEGARRLVEFIEDASHSRHPRC